MTIDSRVLRLVGDVQGLIDLDEFREGLMGALKQEIRADCVSVRTAQKHVERAFRKLGVSTRSRAAARAWELSGAT